MHFLKNELFFLPECIIGSKMSVDMKNRCFMAFGNLVTRAKKIVEKIREISLAHFRLSINKNSGANLTFFFLVFSGLFQAYLLHSTANHRVLKLLRASQTAQLRAEAYYKN